MICRDGVSLTRFVTEQLKQRVMKGTLKPGDRLPTEAKLCEEFEVSRTTVREAMKVLAAENIVTVRQGSGTYVNNYMGVTDDPLGLLFSDHEVLMENLFEARVLIEPEIVSLAAMRANQKDIEKLKKCLNRHMQQEWNSMDSARLDVEFHAAIASCTHNEVLIRLVPIINEAILRSFADTVDRPESFQRSKEEHLAMVNAIIKRDMMEARFVMESHIRKTLSDAQERRRSS